MLLKPGRYLWRIGIELIVLLGMIADATPVLADVAPPPPPFGSNPYGDYPGTQVQMVSELVAFDVASTSPYKNGHAKVTATFQMRNQGTQDEKMLVRFPLGSVLQGDCIYSPQTSISDLAASVNAIPVETTTTYETVTTLGTTPVQDASIPCWAHFPVTFPSRKNVTIQVTYTALGYGDPVTGNLPDDSLGFAGTNPSAAVSYWYVLETGAGWYGPIGKADIIFHFPYEVNDKNIDFSILDSSWKSSGNELRWHEENFEPDGPIRVYLTNPVTWESILTETRNTQANPKDGEAWGRLGQAYKEAIWVRRGFRRDPGGLAMYQLSDQAYQRAVNLLPKDASLHDGYAELLCWQAEWGHESGSQLTNSDWVSCIQQLKVALDLNPKDEKANDTLQQLARFNPGIVDLSGDQPDFLTLTPQPAPTLTYIPTSTTSTPTQSQPVSTTSVAAPTALEMEINTPTPEFVSLATDIVPTSIPSSTSSLDIRKWEAIVLALLTVFMASAFWVYRRMK